jgi:hypothetical protein
LAPYCYEHLRLLAGGGNVPYFRLMEQGTAASEALLVGVVLEHMHLVRVNVFYCGNNNARVLASCTKLS